MVIGHRLRDLEDPLTSGLYISDVLDLVEHAPTDSALYRAVHREEADWSLSNQLLASLFDAANQRLYQAGGGKGPKPKPIPRPGVTEKESKQYKSSRASTMAEIDAWMASRVQPA